MWIIIVILIVSGLYLIKLTVEASQESKKETDELEKQLDKLQRGK